MLAQRLLQRLRRICSNNKTVEMDQISQLSFCLFYEFGTELFELVHILDLERNSLNFWNIFDHKLEKYFT